jgi:predicted HTH domain antitoxin
MIKKEQIVGTRLPQSLINDLEKIEKVDQSDRSTTLRKLLSGAIREWKLDYYAKEYARGRITMSRAAEEAEVPLWEMLEYARQQKIPAQYSLEDLQHDMQMGFPVKKTARRSDKTSLVTVVKAARAEYLEKGGRPWDEVRQEINGFIAKRKGKK